MLLVTRGDAQKIIAQKYGGFGRPPSLDGCSKPPFCTILFCASPRVTKSWKTCLQGFRGMASKPLHIERHRNWFLCLTASLCLHAGVRTLWRHRFQAPMIRTKYIPSDLWSSMVGEMDMVATYYTSFPLRCIWFSVCWVQAPLDHSVWTKCMTFRGELGFRCYHKIVEATKQGQLLDNIENYPFSSKSEQMEFHDTTLSTTDEEETWLLTKDRQKVRTHYCFGKSTGSELACSLSGHWELNSLSALAKKKRRRCENFEEHLKQENRCWSKYLTGIHLDWPSACRPLHQNDECWDKIGYTLTNRWKVQNLTSGLGSRCMSAQNVYWNKSMCRWKASSIGMGKVAGANKTWQEHVGEKECAFEYEHVQVKGYHTLHTYYFSAFHTYFSTFHTCFSTFTAACILAPFTSNLAPFTPIFAPLEPLLASFTPILAPFTPISHLSHLIWHLSHLF